MRLLRQANEDDHIQVLELIEELEGPGIDKRAFLKIYRTNLENPLVSYFVYVDADTEELLGFISIHIQPLLHHAANIAEIQELTVREAFKGQGIGRLLFHKAVEISKAYRCSQLEVCCNHKRTSSHEFYLAMGMDNDHYKFTLVLY